MRLIGLCFVLLFMTLGGSSALADNLTAYTNSLGMRFVSVPKLTNVTFCIWLTRVQDFRHFVADRTNNGGYDYHNGKTAYTFKGKYDYQKGRTAYILTSNDWTRGTSANGWNNPGFEQQEGCPVVCVNWEDAKWFCTWLTRKEHAEGTLVASRKYRLPTDAEWSIAAGLEGESGETPAEKSMKIKDVYAWGTQWPPPRGSGNFGGEEAQDKDWPPQLRAIAGYRDGYPRTSPVGSFAANRYGLYDMAGNAGEWCEDSYNGVPHLRVWRGGTWNSIQPGHLWLSTRGFDVLDSRYSVVGFRIVISASQ